jgi:hypothetical protein
MPTCSHVAQSSSAQVLCVGHTKGTTSVSGCAQLFQHKGPWAMDEIVRSRQLVFHSTCDVRAHFVGAQRTMTPRPSSTPCSVYYFLLFADRVCTAMPALPPSRTPPYRAHSCHGLRLPLSFRAQRFLDAPAHAQAHPDRAAIPLLVCLWY